LATLERSLRLLRPVVLVVVVVVVVVASLGRLLVFLLLKTPLLGQCRLLGALLRLLLGAFALQLRTLVRLSIS